jgi:hypothetical protein
MLWGYSPISKVKIKGSRLGSCDSDLSSHLFVEFGTRTKLKTNFLLASKLKPNLWKTYLKIGLESLGRKFVKY